MNLHNGNSILDWNYYETQAKNMSEDQLKFAIEDCSKALTSVKGLVANYPCKGEGFYADELCVYSDELRRRKKK